VGAAPTNPKDRLRGRRRGPAGTRPLAAALSALPYTCARRRRDRRALKLGFFQLGRRQPVPVVVCLCTPTAPAAASVLVICCWERGDGVPNIGRGQAGRSEASTRHHSMVMAGRPPGRLSSLADDRIATCSRPCSWVGQDTIAASRPTSPRAVSGMIELRLAARWRRGRPHPKPLLPLVKAAFAEPNPAVIKGWSDHATGSPEAQPALPQTELAGGGRAPPFISILGDNFVLGELDLHTRQGTSGDAGQDSTSCRRRLTLRWIRRIDHVGRTTSVGFKVWPGILAAISIGSPGR